MIKAKFFRNLWRINGILIFLAASMAITLLGIAALSFMNFGHHAPKQSVQVDTQVKEAAVEPPTMRSFENVSGTPFLRAKLTFGEEYGRDCFSSQKAAIATRNYLFLDSTSLQSHWLFPSNQQLITESDELSESNGADPFESRKTRTTAFIYHVIDTDTNGDKQLTTDDKVSIAYSRPDGNGYTSVLKGINKVLGTHTIDKGSKHVIAYEIDKKWYAATISLSTFTIEKKETLPVMP